MTTYYSPKDLTSERNGRLYGAWSSTVFPACNGPWWPGAFIPVTSIIGPRSEYQCSNPVTVLVVEANEPPRVAPEFERAVDVACDASELMAGDFANVQVLLGNGACVTVGAGRFSYQQYFSMAKIAFDKGGHLTISASGLPEAHLLSLAIAGKSHITITVD